ncbi:hypothetical protein Cni_G18886 [Canna indica]|uniref:Calcium uniporter protein C-terminal domain-containing protein n=1 Tax=Canna indica TaxID=4628 RepID=A0AAQ3KLV6_9LILI|nr:hypothetical protein Cni_G18886 [Canna indica]
MKALRKALARSFQVFSSASPSAGAAPPPARLRDLLPPGIRRLLYSSLQKSPLFQPARPPENLSRIPGLNPCRLRIDLILPQSGTIPAAAEEEKRVAIKDVRKVVRTSQMSRARAKLRETAESCISRSAFVRICCEALGGEQGVEVARSLGESGDVVVWGNVVFLRPEELIKAIENVIPPSLPTSCDDAQKEELNRMEKTKAEIDQRAAAQVRRELWCGLGFLAAQTAAFMRLTFWELSWDVMEPICYYVTSFYFICGYAFFLRTCKEPSFEGFFDSRFTVRQKRLMKAANFDLQRFDDLRQACRPQYPPRSSHFQRIRSTSHRCP